MSKLKRIQAYEIIDSRGFPTIEAKLWLDDDRMVRTSVPAGTSIGKYEALELRDNDPKRFDSQGVSRAVSYINDLIAPKLVGVDSQKIREVDEWLIKADGSKNMNRIGANTTLTVSQLMVKAAALDVGLPLFQYINKLYATLLKDEIPIAKIPTPIFNIINGGKHANNRLNFQEYHLIPTSSMDFSQGYQMGVEVFHELKKVLKYRNADVTVGEEGGLTPNFGGNLDPFEIINETVMQKDLKIGLDVFLGTDMAASHFFGNDRYVVIDKTQPLSREDFIDYILKMTKSYSLLYIEDPLNEDDWDGWQKLCSELSESVYLSGDDLTVTNRDRLLQAIKKQACSAIVIKPNQIGTITETLQVVGLARKNKIAYTVSHRSGETNDDFIADLAVGLQSEFVKFGAPCRGERVSKYNRLWEIEREFIKAIPKEQPEKV